MDRLGSIMTVALAAGAIALGGCSGTPSASREPTPISTSRTTEPSAEQQSVLDDARIAMESGNYDSAMSLFQGILGENPTIPDAYIGIGDIHMVHEDYASAEPAFRRAARLEPRSYDAQYKHGLSLQMLRRFAEAIRAYQRALRIEPADADANANIATSFLQLSDPKQALRYAERAVELEPDNGPARANLGAIYEELGMFTEAIDTYIAALELMGNRAPLMLNLINALAEEKRYREAVNTAETLVRIGPSANAYERLGWCHFKLREFDESMTAYREAVTLDPGHWPSLNGVGVNALNTWLLSKRRDDAARDEARGAFRRSLQANPGQKKVIDLMLNYGL